MKIPGEAVLTGHLLVVEYLDSDGEFHMKAECTGTGNETLALGKTLELIEFARVQAVAPMMAEAVSEFFDYDEIEVDYDDEDEDYEDEEESDD